MKVEKRGQTRKLKLRRLGAKMTQIEQRQIRIENFRRLITPHEIKGAPPIKGRRVPGHARSKHGIKVDIQAGILNYSERIFSGIN